MVVFESDARVNGAAVKVVQFVKTGQNVVFNCLGQSHIVRRKDQFHTRMMQLKGLKIQ